MNEAVRVQTVVTFLGEGKLQLQDVMFSASGVELAKLTVLYAIVNFQKRKMVSLSKDIETKGKAIEEPRPPNKLEVKQASGSVQEHRKVIQAENIDYNKHTNFAFYAQVAMEGFQMIGQHLSCLEEFALMVKKETVENDVLSSSVWKDEGTGLYCCKTMCNGRLVMYAEALFNNQQSKL